jgi:tetratricopeptide (TPR) repeat protein
MLLGWLDARRATEFGIALADQFATQTVSVATGNGRTAVRQQKHSAALRECLQRADREMGAASLNFYKKAKLANAFKWRLLEKGVANTVAAEVTQTLVMHLSLNRAASVPGGTPSTATPSDSSEPSKPQDLLASAAAYEARGALAEAIAAYQALLRIKPRNAIALNNLGAIFGKLSRLDDADQCFRRALALKPNFAEAQFNLGSALRGRGQLPASEHSLRRALKLKPNYLDARASLGVTLVALGRPIDAKVQLEKVLRASPHNAIALLAMGQVATMEGRFEEAEALFKRVLDASPSHPSALAGLVDLRRMTLADSDWLKQAEQAVTSGLIAAEEVNLRFAIGKYHDDVANYVDAFQSYKRGNEMLKERAEGYDRSAHTRFADDLIRTYVRDSLDRAVDSSAHAASASMKPVFVVGMPRSGTSLVEQVIASHPAAAGAGELTFWTEAVQQRETSIRQGPLGMSTRKELAHSYLQILQRLGGSALRVVDKAPINSDYLGVIHSVFPNARILYMRRHPIDTCLSCYFQQFSVSMNYTMDLADLAHYYRQHHRLIAHWRAVLPPGSILDVPYAELVSDQEGWTRRILDFVGLEWDPKCLDFHDTKRPVATASAWQVRQKVYGRSVGRWRHYEQFIGPLRGLEDLDW